MSYVTRDSIEARLLLPVLNFSLACISEKRGSIAEAKTALIDEVEKIVADAEAKYRSAKRAKAPAIKKAPEAVVQNGQDGA